jgi:hypothetical protein
VVVDKADDEEDEDEDEVEAEGAWLLSVSLPVS